MTPKNVVYTYISTEVPTQYCSLKTIFHSATESLLTCYLLFVCSLCTLHRTNTLCMCTRNSTFFLSLLKYTFAYYIAQTHVFMLPTSSKYRRKNTLELLEDHAWKTKKVLPLTLHDCVHIIYTWIIHQKRVWLVAQKFPVLFPIFSSPKVILYIHSVCYNVCAR